MIFKVYYQIIYEFFFAIKESLLNILQILYIKKNNFFKENIF